MNTHPDKASKSHTKSPDELLKLARGDELNAVQIDAILGQASQLGLSLEQREELQEILRNIRHNTIVPKNVCSVCGQPAIPGDNYCYTHSIK